MSMASIPNARYERKLLATGLSLAQVLALVRRHPAAFRQVYPERVVNNIYLDSPSLASYREHVNGTPNRQKIRVRWYGDAAGAVEIPVLEQKLKRGAVSGKIAHAMPPLHTGQPIAWSGISPKNEPSYGLTPSRETLTSAFGDACLPDSVRASVRHLEPALFNRYRRQYFLSGERRFRLTVDFALEFARLHSVSATPKHLLRAGPLVVVELKYAPADEDRAAGITNEFPFRVRRCSKYVLGIGATGWSSAERV